MDLFELYQLLQVSQNKLILEFDKIDWKRMTLIGRFEYNESENLVASNQIMRSPVSAADFSVLAQFASKYFEYISRALNIDDETIKLFQSMKCSIVCHGRFDILPLKRCYSMGIMYGTSCSELNAWITTQNTQQIIRSRDGAERTITDSDNTQMNGSFVGIHLNLK